MFPPLCQLTSPHKSPMSGDSFPRRCLKQLFIWVQICTGKWFHPKETKKKKKGRKVGEGKNYSEQRSGVIVVSRRAHSSRYAHRHTYSLGDWQLPPKSSTPRFRHMNCIWWRVRKTSTSTHASVRACACAFLCAFCIYVAGWWVLVCACGLKCPSVVHLCMLLMCESVLV